MLNSLFARVQLRTGFNNGANTDYGIRSTLPVAASLLVWAPDDVPFKDGAHVKGARVGDDSGDGLE